MRSRTVRLVNQVRLMNTGAFRPGGLDCDTFKNYCENRGLYVKHCLGLKVESMSEGAITLRLPSSRQNHNISRNAAMIGLIDHCGGFGSWTLLDSNKFLSTVDLRVDYLAPIPDGGDIVAEATVLNKGDSFVHADVVCWDSERKTKLAIARTLFFIYDSPISRNKTPPENFEQIEAIAREYSGDIFPVTVHSLTKPGVMSTLLSHRAILMGNRFLRILHGGVTAAFLEKSGQLCAQSLLEGENAVSTETSGASRSTAVSTVDLDISYLKGAPIETNIICDAIVSSRSSRLIRVDFSCWDEARKVKIAAGAGLYMIL